MDDVYSANRKMAKEIDQLRAENERLRKLIEGKGCDPDIVLRNKRDAEKYRTLMYDNEMNTEFGSEVAP